MSFSDPQSVTIAAATTSLPRTVVQPTSSTYTSADGTIVLTVSQSAGRTLRSLARVDISKISTDPLTDVKLKATASAYIVIQRPLVGFTPTELKDLAVGLTAFLTASSNAKLIQLVGGEA